MYNKHIGCSILHKEVLFNSPNEKLRSLIRNIPYDNHKDDPPTLKSLPEVKDDDQE